MYWLTLLERLKALSGLTAQEILINRSSSLRCHPIKWEDTSENGFGLPNEEQLSKSAGKVLDLILPLIAVVQIITMIFRGIGVLSMVFG